MFKLKLEWVDTTIVKDNTKITTMITNCRTLEEALNLIPFYKKQYRITNITIYDDNEYTTISTNL